MAEAFHAESGNPIDAEAEAAALILSLGDAQGSAWLAFDRGVTVGYAVVACIGKPGPSWDAELEELYVVPSDRHAERARALLIALCRVLATERTRRLCVAVAPSDTGCRYYFWRHGFVLDHSGLMTRLLP